MTVSHRSPTVTRKRSTDRYPVSPPLGVTVRDTVADTVTVSRRERAPEKAARLLVSGSVRVLYAHGREVRVLVQGDHDTYIVEHLAGRWLCSCPSYRACSHRIAAELVTAPVAGTWIASPRPQVAVGGQR